jgi:Domain of unknown function (DUF4440)
VSRHPVPRSTPARASTLLLGALVAISPGSLAGEDPTAVLQGRTQSLLDAVTRGDASVWERLLDERALIVSEDGEVSDKRAAVAGIRPLPSGVSGTLRVTGFRAVAHGDTAVTTYVADEEETFHGTKLHSRYRVNETWVRSGGEWKLLSGQVLALRSDPPARELKPEQRREYCGTYALGDLAYVVRCEPDGLTGAQTGRAPKPLRLESPDVFFVPGEPRTRRFFQRDPAGKITGFIERRESWDLFWRRAG